MIEDIKQKSNIRFLIGGVCATAIPFIIGLILLAIPILAEQNPSCHYGAKNISIACDIYQNFGSEFYWFIMLPIILSFIFVTPIIAAISISSLQERVSLTWSDIFLTSIAKSTKANLWVALAYNTVLCLIVIGTSIGTGGIATTLGTLVMMVVFIAFIQFGLWLFITLPLALICAGVFGVIAKPRGST